MLSISVLGAIILLVAPFLIWSRYQKSKRTVYQGPATILHSSLLGSAPVAAADYDFLHVDVPGRESMIVKVSGDRLKKLSGVASSVQITISSYSLGKPFIETVQWPGESQAEEKETEFKGLYLSGFYLLLGLGTLALIAYLSAAGLGIRGHALLYYSALQLAAAGFIMGRYMQTAPVNRKEVSAKFLFIPLGKGTLSLYLVLGLCAVLTAVSFWWISLLTLLIGINAAMSLGGVLAIFSKLGKQPAN